MKKSKFWTSCDYCGASNIEDWKLHIKECPKIPQKERKVLLEMGKDISKTDFNDFSVELKNILRKNKPKSAL